MKSSRILLLVAVFSLTPLLLPGAAFILANTLVTRAGAASIKILSPADNARVAADEEYALAYQVTWGSGGDHFHVWVDGKRGPGVYNTKGTYTLPKLSPGEHVITIKVVDKGHIPTGIEKS